MLPAPNTVSCSCSLSLQLQLIVAVAAYLLVSGEPVSRPAVPQPLSSGRCHEANAEVKPSADNQHLERNRDYPEGQSQNPAEQLEHHADGKEAQHGEKADHEDGA